MDKITFFKDRGYLVASIQGYVTATVRAGMRNCGFRYDKDTGVYRAPLTDSAESYLLYLEKVCHDRAKKKEQFKSSKESYLELFNEGLSILEIAARKNVQESTVYKNLVKEVENGSLDFRKLMNEARFHMIKEYIYDKDITYLKPLKENAPFELEYWELELVRLCSR